MSHDSDISDMGRFLTQRRKECHADWKIKNMAILEASELKYKVTNGGETVLFRDNGLCVDFYPSTGRWRRKTGLIGAGRWRL